MSYKELIDWLKPFAYSQYKDVTSYEKLMMYAALKLEEIKVPLTFNYICIASFKLFPDKFCCDNEFKEFPSVDRLNRTMMHLKYVKNWGSCLTWSIGNWYQITNLWRAVAKNKNGDIEWTNI